VTVRAPAALIKPRRSPCGALVSAMISSSLFYVLGPTKQDQAPRCNISICGPPSNLNARMNSPVGGISNPSPWKLRRLRRQSST
jgi:hypothetical protein